MQRLLGICEGVSKNGLCINDLIFIVSGLGIILHFIRVP